MNFTATLKTAADILIWSRTETKKRAEKRLKKLKAVVTAARDYSPYFNRKYAGLGDSYALTDLPSTDHEELSEHLDTWLTDRLLDVEELELDSEDVSFAAMLVDDKYLAVCSEEDLISLRDLGVNTFYALLYALRSGIGVCERLRALLRGNRVADVCLKGDGTAKLHLSASARMPVAGRYCGGDARTKEELISDLNGFAPAVVRSCSHSLSRLTALAEAGELNIKPVYMRANMKNGSAFVGSRAEAVFGCRVHGEVMFPEFGDVAVECKAKHFHVNDDAFFVEAVDANNNPVADGILSDHILVTDLQNTLQPYLRYAKPLSVVMHFERCQCGRSGKWFELG